MEDHILTNWLKKRAELTPNRSAIEFEGYTYSFADLDRMVVQMAGKLAAKGIKAGDTCALLLRNHIDSVVCIHALFYLGVQIVMLNNKLTAFELAWQVQDSKAEFLLSESCFLEKITKITQEVSITNIILKEDLTEMKTAQVVKDFNLNDVATIMYTSGTTGKPKGVLQTFGNHWWSAMGSVLNLGLTENDCWYCAVPIFHISGLSILMRNVIYGMKVVLVEKFDEVEANRSITENGVTIISVVTTMVNRMLAVLGNHRYLLIFVACFSEVALLQSIC